VRLCIDRLKRRRFAQSAVVAVCERLMAQWLPLVGAASSLTSSQGAADAQDAQQQHAAKKARTDSGLGSAAAVVKSATASSAADSTPSLKAADAPNSAAAMSRSSSLAGSRGAAATPSRSASGVSLADPVRERAAQMLAEALTPADDAAQAGEPTAADDFESDPAQTGAAIERALFDKHKGDTSKDYKQQMRSLYANLKNKKNPGLRKSIMVGELTPLEFVNMSVHDLADPELVEQRRKDAEWATKVAMGPALSQAAPTDAFVCPRCKQRKCRYIMLQTRSADEPMTTFITCANCGHHWRNG
jgi:transcription elongation factor S-II